LELEKTLEVQLRYYGEFHSNTLQSYFQLSELYFNLGIEDRAKECMLKVKEISEKLK